MERWDLIRDLVLRTGITVMLLTGWHARGASVPATLTAAHSTDSQRAILEFNEENDYFAGADRHYTQGFRIAYLSADNCLPGPSRGWIKLFPSFGFRLDICRTGLELGQSLYTPKDISAEEPIPNDHPYAGWLYGGIVLQRRGVTRSLHIPVLETMRIQVGIVGSGAMAEQVQDIVHIVARVSEPQGWHNQLHTEPGLAAKYQRAWRWSPRGPRKWNADFIPHAGASLGNVDTSLRAGATVRVGRYLPDDFGVQTIDSLGFTEGGQSSFADTHTWGFYGFIGTEGKAVAWTTFLDGNLFESNPSVDKKPLVAEFKSGLVLVFSRTELAVVYVVRSEEFYGQESGDAFGSVFLKLKF
ncbi:MAG: lipid A deacylase LpxR family protein [Kiritimatiellae bacterium]|nr:lipid A deacylase LpxR family protein [Kiritimatiellia bacterium]